ncbi:hemerythrin domain-containing protein [Ramlibacter sp. AN1133]|uniref:hemerythrin domain-containing protein n=1 Tax=Ramlibacter sp. AN1133 TaxID=3133429 RepID=UPI0030C3371D
MPTLALSHACELLDADHIAVKHLFVEYARLAMAAPLAVAERQPIAARICAELTVHAQIEEEIFYPALRKAIDAPELLDEAQAEHRQAKELIAKIQGTRRASPALDDLVSELARAVEQHVKEERDVLFPKAKSADGLDLEALGERLRERQQELESRGKR